MSSIVVQLPDGSERELPAGATAYDLAADIGPGLAKAALIATVDGQERDLNTELTTGASVALITDSSEQGLETLRHSTSHVLAQAVLELWPGATFAIGPPIEHGFYYDFELPKGGTFSDEDLERIDTKMRDIIAADQP
ncbi:MAG: TGS domain-containing protein, partial [Acidimicrobiaceae bacterium]|nr:TGS domain-containing protein [Acidimicrobiaceae bacterium]